jgi:hypothetical protein
MAGVLMAAAAGSALADAPKWGAHLDLEGRWGEKRALGDVGLFAPLWQSPMSIFFADIRGKLDNHDSAEGNFGLGLRHMTPGGWNFGAYGFFDYRRSEGGRFFRQATVGIEALSADWDLRANGYFPFGDTEKSVGMSGGAPFAELANGTIQIVTPGTFELFERALRGADSEIGWRVPVFPAESLAQLRAYAGGFWFEGGAGVGDIYGPRGRLELSFDDAFGIGGARFTLGGEVQHDNLRGTQAYAMARLRIPLQPASRAAPRLTAQEARMTERVVRDVDIVVGQRANQITPELREAAVSPFNDREILSAQVVSASSGEAAVVNAIGTAGQDSVIILDGDLTTTQNIVLGNRMTLLGGSGELPVYGANSGVNLTFNPRLARGSLTGNQAGTSVLVLFDEAVAAGLTIENTSTDPFSRGIFMTVSPDAVAFRNTVTAREGGIAIVAFDSAGILVSGNTIAVTGNNSAGVLLDNSSGQIGGNTIDIDGDSAVGIGFSNGSGGLVFNNTVRSNLVTATAAPGMSFVSSSTQIFGNSITVAGNSNGVVLQDSNVTFDQNEFGPVGGAVIRLEGVVDAGFLSVDNTWTGAGTLCDDNSTTMTGSIGFVGGGTCP